MSKVKLFTHNDLDGCGCEILLNLAFGPENVNSSRCGYYNIDDCVKEFINSNEYNDYDKIFITDISICYELALKIDSYDISNKIKLIDHHQTAIKLNEFQWCNVVLSDAGELSCGTSLLYKYLVSSQYLTASDTLFNFTETIKRYDTWLWSTKYNDITPKRLNLLFAIYGADKFLDIYTNRLLSDNFTLFEEIDNILLDMEESKIDKYVTNKSKSVVKQYIPIGQRVYHIAIVFAEQYINDLGEYICLNNEDIDFVAIISDMRSISFRTRKDNINLGTDIAPYYNGGGHKQAAGATISYNKKVDIACRLIR